MIYGGPRISISCTADRTVDGWLCHDKMLHHMICQTALCCKVFGTLVAFPHLKNTKNTRNWNYLTTWFTLSADLNEWHFDVWLTGIAILIAIGFVGGVSMIVKYMSHHMLKCNLRVRGRMIAVFAAIINADMIFDEMWYGLPFIVKRPHTNVTANLPVNSF